MIKIYTLILLFFLISCSSDHSIDKLGEGTLFSEEKEVINVDGSKVLIRYNGSKVMLDSLSYNAKGNLHGLVMIFDTTTRVKQYYNYINGEKTGKMTSYYPSGDIEYIASFIKGGNIGENIFYYEDGGLKSYECKDYNERLMYQRDYDSLGNVIRSDGFLIYYYGINRDTISLDDSLYFEFEMGRPPHCDVRLFIGDSLNRFADYTNIQYPTYFEHPKDIGVVSRRIFYEITDTISGVKEQVVRDVLTYVKE